MSNIEEIIRKSNLEEQIQQAVRDIEFFACFEHVGFLFLVYNHLNECDLRLDAIEDSENVIKNIIDSIEVSKKAIIYTIKLIIRDLWEVEIDYNPILHELSYTRIYLLSLIGKEEQNLIPAQQIIEYALRVTGSPKPDTNKLKKTYLAIKNIWFGV
ncbi:hypothetical protein [Candidatus Liberibacter africanus]|uniref:Uncharacterized protein n=1 Tax=Candidatus Liberibacter africanus PTSAPSY TaxID=1277257 RepID=A0A0G3I1M0_LIBAF|nr:hypothetical protein [Candidatus Liberibacter africanus]AKK19754.1 hypothetical protein G293_00540 [Candidatus Liberibacter africanus PTSAPSY]